jgi:dihydrodipicolinate synthase/N-acetylneuraminate lyase
MNLQAGIKGVICPIVTPFKAGGAIDLQGARKLVDFLLGRGVHALMVCGTTGEGMMLSLKERESLCEAVVEHVAGRCPVIAHTGCIGTADTIRLTCHAQTAGARTAAIVVPYFFTLDDEAIFAHYTHVAAAVPDFPLFIYTIPANARNDISPELLQRLRKAAPNVIGMKCSNPNVLLMQQYLEVAGEGFTFIGGVDGLMLTVLLLGGQGQVSGNANAYPEVFRGLYDAVVAGDIGQAKMQQRLINRVRTVLRDGRYPAYYKAALTRRGVPAGRVRPPMRELTAGEWKQLEQDMAELNLD